MAISKTDKIVGLFSNLSFAEQKIVLENLTAVFGKSLEEEMAATSAKKHELEGLKDKYGQ